MATAYRFLMPDRYNLFAPLDIAAEPTFVTGMKLRGLKGDPRACFGALDGAGITYTRLDNRDTGTGCGFEDVAVLDRSQVSWGGGVRATCPLLAALAVWERHDLQPLANEHLGTDAVRVRHLGTYACRNIAASGRRSQHATANAIDVAGFVLADGREVSVLRDWGKDSPEGRFLTAVRDRACDRFSTTLGPEYNAAHADHFHLDMGFWGICK